MRLSYSNVMSTLAVFLVIAGGTALALSKNSVKSATVKDNSLKSKDLRDGKAVGAADVIPSQVQLRVGGSCPAGQAIRVINVEGGVVCEVGQAGVGPDTVGSANVVNNSLTGDDVDESTLEGVDAATLDGLSRLEYVFRSGISGPPSREESMVFYAYTMVTPEAGTDYIVGQLKLRTTATPQEFQVCGSTGLTDPVQYVRYIEGVRTEDTVPGDSCDAAVNFGDFCDFEILGGNGTRVFGAPVLGGGNNCLLLALHAT